MSFGVTITGIEDVNHVLATVAPREAVNLMRATIFELVKDIAVGVESRTPDDTGNLDKLIIAKRDRGKRGTLAASVRVGKGAFYWKFLEYGQGPDHVEHAMFLQTLQALRPDLDRKYIEIFTKKLIARLNRKRKQG